jgi:hypothetical protein
VKCSVIAVARILAGRRSVELYLVLATTKR